MLTVVDVAHNASQAVKSPNVGQVLDRNQGLGPGFDFLRLSLASGVMLWHSAQFTIGESAYFIEPSASLNILAFMFVPIFFALSGFLVMGSLMRLRELYPFIAFRALQIFPALIVEVSLSALVLGPIVTEYALTEYFSDWKFWKYFGSLIGFV